MLLLGEGPELDRGPDPAFARRRLELAVDQSREHALAGAVGADDADSLAAHNGQRDVQQHRLVAEHGVHTAQLDHALAAAPFAAQPKAHLAALKHRPLDLLHAVDLALLDPRLLHVALVLALLEPLLEP